MYATEDNLLGLFRYNTYTEMDFYAFNMQYTPTCVPCGDFGTFISISTAVAGAETVS